MEAPWVGNAEYRRGLVRWVCECGMEYRSRTSQKRCSRCKTECCEACSQPCDGCDQTICCSCSVIDHLETVDLVWCPSCYSGEDTTSSPAPEPPPTAGDLEGVISDGPSLVDNLLEALRMEADQ